MTTWKTSRGNLSNRKRKMEKKHHRQQEHHRPQSKQCIERVVRVFVVFFITLWLETPGNGSDRSMQNTTEGAKPKLIVSTENTP